jgi:hypothetical protein
VADPRLEGDPPNSPRHRVFNFLFGFALGLILVGSVALLVFFPDWNRVLVWSLSAASLLGLLAAIFGDPFLKGFVQFLGESWRGE